MVQEQDTPQGSLSLGLCEFHRWPTPLTQWAAGLSPSRLTDSSTTGTDVNASFVVSVSLAPPTSPTQTWAQLNTSGS